MAAQTITVTNATELNQALANATGGETIELAAGDYGKLSLNGSQYASTVTIKSADPNATASFSAGGKIMPTVPFLPSSRPAHVSASFSA